MDLFRISGGTVYDPANGLDGVVKDVWIADGKIVAAPTDPSVRPTRWLDATGYIVMPGGIDMHSHLAGPKVNVARKMRPEEKRKATPIPRTANTRSGTGGSVPNTFGTGYLYAGLGYTTAFDAAIPALFARHAHEEFQDTPLLDKGFLVLAGNNHYVMNQIRAGDRAKLDAYLAWLVNSAKAYGLKIVNPGGVEEWKGFSRHTLNNLDETVQHFHVTPRQIIREVAASSARLGLPHPVHIHCNNLGMPGNWRTTLETMKALEGDRGHIAHIQFHSYGGGESDESSFRSAVPQLVEYVHAHPEITLDVGHLTFGPTTSLTGDGPLGYFLHRLTGNKWFSGDTEMETGCGIVPMEYKEKSLINSVQWAIGLEWYLLMQDPWRMALSTDHPNGGTFLRYPGVIRLLMDREFRKEWIAKAHPKLAERSVLGDLDREYSLGEMVTLTRAAPAKILGLPHKGHLGSGADADLTIYSRAADWEATFSLPRYVIKAGVIVVEDGQVRIDAAGETLFTEPLGNDDLLGDIRTWFESYYTIRFENYPVDLHYLPRPRRVACATKAQGEPGA